MLNTPRVVMTVCSVIASKRSVISSCIFMHTCKGLVFLCCVAVILFQEVWGKSFCRTIENLVEVVQEYPGEVEHIFSPACVPLVRCAGCCGDENLECHPTLTSNTTMQVRIFPLTSFGIQTNWNFNDSSFCCRWKPRNRGRKRKEKKRVKDCDK
uniref:Placental growth factor b n=1 Tax=Sinocyclocheilus rhinocerous TaxID=307959 RepID=A0A673K4G8_9TELE